MAKYSNEQLKAMATALLRYKKENSVSYDQFVVTMSVFYGFKEEYVESMIEKYSKMSV